MFLIWTLASGRSHYKYDRQPLPPAVLLFLIWTLASGHSHYKYDRQPLPLAVLLDPIAYSYQLYGYSTDRQRLDPLSSALTFIQKSGGSTAGS